MLGAPPPLVRVHTPLNIAMSGVPDHRMAPAAPASSRKGRRHALLGSTVTPHTLWMKLSGPLIEELQ
ncbi:hypothetical protein APHAL10511_003363 [Amanita phalloides]|nr:hypothetical protein APHAL10511_003363 [Amanita phalloides]